MSRLLGVLLLLVGGLVGSVAFGATPAFACSCARLDDAAKVEWAGAVFTGTISGRRENPALDMRSDPRLAITYDVSVDRVYKGEIAAATTTVSTASSSASCGVPGLPEGRAVAFFVSRETDGTVSPDTMTVSSCGGTAVLTPELEGAIVAALGEGAPVGGVMDPTAPGDPADPAGPSESADDKSADGEHNPLVPVWFEIVLLAGALAVALGLAVLLVVLFRRRKR